MNTPGTNRLASFPVDQQKKYMAEPVELVVINGEKLLVDVKYLSVRQTDQVFGPEGVRSEAEQRAFIEDQVTKSYPAIDASKPYKIKGKRVFFRKGCSATEADLIALLSLIRRVA